MQMKLNRICASLWYVDAVDVCIWSMLVLECTQNDRKFSFHNLCMHACHAIETDDLVLKFRVLSKMHMGIRKNWLHLRYTHTRALSVALSFPVVQFMWLHVVADYYYWTHKYKHKHTRTHQIILLGHHRSSLKCRIWNDNEKNKNENISVQEL